MSDPFWKLKCELRKTESLVEWIHCKYSDLIPEYDTGDSIWYATAKKLGIPLDEVKKELLPPTEKEIWSIPKEWLDEQPTATEIKEDE